MESPPTGPDVVAGRLDAAELQRRFSDAHPALTHQQALVESDRCYFCHDAPCTVACPTGIDIPSFIRKIATGNLPGSAHDILKENVMGASCARVCPTEVLCEGACVRQHGEGRPVAIGALQRHATDHVFDRGIQLFQRAPATGRTVAVVGAGPAGLSCAHRLAMLGHDVTVFESRPRTGGLNEYGIAAYKVTDDIAQREVAYLLQIGGIEVRTRMALGRDLTLSKLEADFDAVFLAIGLGGVNVLGVPGEHLKGVHDAVEFIARLRQAADLSTLPVGRRVVVIGGGMTAIDIATQMRLLGAEEVTIVYRRGAGHMGASEAEQHWAQTHGVTIRHWAQPVAVVGSGDVATGVEFEGTLLRPDGRLEGTGRRFTLAADMVFKAIGQQPDASLQAELAPLSGGAGRRIEVDGARRARSGKVWAGGDCVAGGKDLTVVAVEDGKRAALAIDAFLRAQGT